MKGFVLTDRERAVVAYQAIGLSITRIAFFVGRSRETVRDHLERARIKAGASNAANLIDAAYRFQALPRPAPEPRTFTITARQQRGLELVAQGRTGRGAAQRLGISHQEFEAEIRRLRTLMKATSRAHMVSRGWALRLLE
ncbi:LuxR C-terminal-related transcriptional regulator [Streptomyces lavendulae]|uniref:LuxR C-terminal-related transcriptional regulator n=1 Tax=Streptomyces lavendulae TaxID=1914 RepID=UPI003820D183